MYQYFLVKVGLDIFVVRVKRCEFYQDAVKEAKRMMKPFCKVLNENNSEIREITPWWLSQSHFVDDIAQFKPVTNP